MTVSAVPLDALQRWMLSALTTPAAFDRAAIAEHLLPGPQLNAAACLQIYQRSYILRLRACLAAQFPATCHALGADLFNDFADSYLRALPPDSYTLDQLGRRFAGWLDETRIDRDRPLPEREDWIDFMVDLAHYERTLFVLYDSPGLEDGLPPGTVWPDADTRDQHLCLQPTLVLRQYRHGVAWYYHEVRAGRQPGFPPPAPMHLALVRQDYQTTTYPVSALHFRFLEAVRDRGTVAAALSDIAAWTGRSLTEVTQSWARDVRRPWIAAGFFLSAPTGLAPDPCEPPRIGRQ